MRLLRAMSKFEETIHAVGEARASCYHTPRMRSRGFAEATAVVLAGAALTVALTYPLAFRIDRIGRMNTADGHWSVWVVAWVAHALTTEPLNLYNANIFYPHSSTLAFSEANIGAGVIGVPVWLVTKNPHTTHNFVVLVSFVIAFAGAYYLTRYLTGNRSAAAVAGVMFAYCPYIFARTAHIQLLLTGGLPFCMLAFHRLADRQTVTRAVTLGLLIWAQALSCAYYGIFAALMIGVAVIVVAGTRRLWTSKDYWVAVSLAAFVSIALALPFFLPYLRVQENAGFARTLDDARMYSANPSAWGASSAWAHRWLLDIMGKFNEVLFPGIMATVLGVAGAGSALTSRVAASREIPLLYTIIAVLAFWSSFGPDAGLYRLFYETIPIFSFLRAPGRMGIMVTLALCVLAAGVISKLQARWGHPVIIGSLLLVITMAELNNAPLQQYRDVSPPPRAYRVLATLPRGAVIELPYWYQRPNFPRHAEYMLNSTIHWQPLVNGYSDHIPQDFRMTVLQFSSFPSRESFLMLGRIGARYAVFHLDNYDERNRARLMERLKTYANYLRPLVQEDSVWLYEIVDWPN